MRYLMIALLWMLSINYTTIVCADNSTTVIFNSDSNIKDSTDNLIALSESYKRLANNENILAQYRLGVAYGLGRGVEQNYVQSAYWYLQAAKKGNADSQYNLGLMYLVGLGVKKNNILAYNWILKAARHKHLCTKKTWGNVPNRQRCPKKPT